MFKKDFTLLFLVVIFFSLVFDSVGQQASSGFDLRYKLGYLSIHHESMAHLPKSPAQAIEFTYFQHTNGKRNYQRAYRFPTLGATFFHGTVGNTQLLGRYTGIYGFSELPLVKIKSFESNFKLATGVAVTTKCFQNAPQNIAIGSYLNAMICVGVKSMWRWKNQHVSWGGDMTHCSNGASEL
ncbi:MAG: hypothetical protein ACKO00_05535, partial [Crocinitomicaceae bacterium]